MMSITGTPDTAPQRVGFPVCDTAGGLTAALAIATANADRQRDGLGCFLDVSMLESSGSAMGWTVTNYRVGGVRGSVRSTNASGTAPDMVDRAQLEHRQFFTELPLSGTDEANDRTLRIDCNGVLVDGELLHVKEPPPLLGQHNGKHQTADP